VTEEGLAVRGVLVRHLVMPGLLEDTGKITRYLGQLSLDTYLNLMDQYYPAYRVETEEKFQEIRRRVTRRETEEALAAARAAGLWRFDTRWRRFHRPLQLWA